MSIDFIIAWWGPSFLSSERLEEFIIILLFMLDILTFCSVIDSVRIYFWFTSLTGWVRRRVGTTGLSVLYLPYTSTSFLFNALFWYAFFSSSNAFFSYSISCWVKTLGLITISFWETREMLLSVFYKELGWKKGDWLAFCIEVSGNTGADWGTLETVFEENILYVWFSTWTDGTDSFGSKTKAGIWLKAAWPPGV